ncbi:hypothetical protein CAI21_20525 [Alkalilimnicola ehrlichii]|uniref:Outer membrane protein beta-barrel domain-containing protein n=1 Tax=Alkalilimnicola ehrlichii TaxID=351052 RepID=A0A3E0WR41_9GAMM|nr:hypothetical protein [Alkalilimnicola ehrlichii]RFA24738.1 hypothetical protein CAI21_20525 [Alkalilimnicola ehrlichii]RFA35430.1 hypothetical protein CAL65_13210 [Alkalilimnicola ehrlichii]
MVRWFFCLLALLLAWPVQAERVRLAAGVDYLQGGFKDDAGKDGALIAFGFEWEASPRLGYGFSLGMRDQDADNGIWGKGDGYLRYRLRPNGALDPFVVGAVSSVGLSRHECSAGANGASPMACGTERSGSYGLSYRLGVAIGNRSGAQLDVFWSQYLGTEDVQLNIVGVRGVF